MRQTEQAEARELLTGAPEHHLATTSQNDEPVLRVLNGVVVDDCVAFHGAIAGEKSTCLGRKAVVSAHRTWAQIPSTFTSPDKACPATTYYESVQVQGTLFNLSESPDKARILDALMQKLQPEGGYLPLGEHLELYKKDLRGVRVFGLRIEHLCGKQNLGQDKPLEVQLQVIRGLFERGAAGDCAAIERILKASPKARPFVWDTVEGQVSLWLSPGPGHVRAHAELLQGEYWRTTSTLQEMETAISQSSAWVGAVAPSGRLVGAARALADGTWNAHLMDVVVSPDWRGRGVGQALVDLLLRHPAVRGCQYQRLGTKDATAFYEKFGFRPPSAWPTDFATQAMLRKTSPQA